MSARDLWRRFQARNRRIVSEVTQLQFELAREGKLRSPHPILPTSQPRTWVVIAFWLFVVFVAIAGWSLLRAGR